MNLQSIRPVYRPDLTGIRVIEWRTLVDKRGNTETTSRVYTIRLYNSSGVLEEYNRERKLDIKA